MALSFPASLRFSGWIGSIRSQSAPGVEFPYLHFSYIASVLHGGILFNPRRVKIPLESALDVLSHKRNSIPRGPKLIVSSLRRNIKHAPKMR